MSLKRICTCARTTSVMHARALLARRWGELGCNATGNPADYALMSLIKIWASGWWNSYHAKRALLAKVVTAACVTQGAILPHAVLFRQVSPAGALIAHKIAVVHPPALPNAETH